MVNLRKWSSTATGNASVAGGANTINFAEGQLPGTLNNSTREVMAQIRSVYTPDEWGWVEHSATASVVNQTSFKIGGDQTAYWTAGRRWRLKSGSSTRYGGIVSSSYTTETTVTVSVDSGSLSASHTLAALSAIDTNNVPGGYLTSASASTAYARLAGNVTFAGNVNISVGASGAYYVANANAGQVKGVIFKSGGVNTWIIASDASDNMGFYRYDASGSFVATPVLISKSTGAVTVETSVNFDGLSNFALKEDVGTGNPGILFDTNDYLEYDRTNNAFHVAIGGSNKLTVTSSGISGVGWTKLAGPTSLSGATTVVSGLTLTNYTQLMVHFSGASTTNAGGAPLKMNSSNISASTGSAAATVTGVVIFELIVGGATGSSGDGTIATTTGVVTTATTDLTFSMGTALDAGSVTIYAI